MQPPIGHALNLGTQAVLLYGSWILTLAVLVIAAVIGRREHTWFYVLLVLSVGVGAFVEPLYDTAMMLYFYSTSGMVAHFTAFGIPQPLWTHSGYVVLYAVPALLIARRAHRGTLTRAHIYSFAALEFGMSCVFEMIGINGGAYAYWGPHVLRILNYPVIIGLLETAQVVVFATVATTLRRHVPERLSGPSLFVVFPCTFLGINFGAGWPTIIAIHLAAPHMAVTLAATLLSAALALSVVHAVARVHSHRRAGHRATERRAAPRTAESGTGYVRHQQVWTVSVSRPTTTTRTRTPSRTSEGGPQATLSASDLGSSTLRSPHRPAAPAPAPVA